MYRILFLMLGCWLSIPHCRAEPPILTDEFDRFLVTSESRVGDVIGVVQPVFPSDKEITWSLIAPVPGADRRRYLEEGQKDATTVVGIDSQTGEVRLKSQINAYPGEYYAEVRATNEDGFMKQVIIVIAREKVPLRENALNAFTQRRESSGLRFYATSEVDTSKIDHAARVAHALLVKDRAGSGAISKALESANASMTIFEDFEQRNTAIEYYMFDRDFNSQDLQDEEIVPDYFRLGGPTDLRRDASIEEITHLIHGGGIIPAYPDVQQRLELATRAAIDRKLFRPWDGLPADSFSHEYLTIGLEIYYGGRQHQTAMGSTTNEDGTPRQPWFRLSTDEDTQLTAENLQKYDPELYAIVSWLFPTKAEFWRAMQWDTI